MRIRNYYSNFPFLGKDDLSASSSQLKQDYQALIDKTKEDYLERFVRVKDDLETLASESEALNTGKASVGALYKVETLLAKLARSALVTAHVLGINVGKFPS